MTPREMLAAILDHVGAPRDTAWIARAARLVGEAGELERAAERSRRRNAATSSRRWAARSREMVDGGPSSSRLREVPDDNAFLRLTFDGGRFNEHRISVSALTEFTTFEKLLAVVAKRLYLEDHPERRRVPKNFQRSGRLYLSGVEHNCITGVLERQEASALKNAVDSKYFDLARDSIEATLAAVARGQPLAQVSEEELGLLLEFGAYLEPTERIVFGPLAEPRAQVDKGSRSKLARATNREIVFEHEFSGEVDKFDDAARRVWIRTDALGGVLEFGVTNAGRKKVIEALDLRPAALLLVAGKAVQKSPTLWRIEGTPPVELIGADRYDDLDALRNRVAILEQLNPGWLDGVGHAPSADLLAFVRDVLSRLLVQDDAVPRPKLYPTPEGGVQAEWLEPTPVELWFSPDGSSLRFEVGDELIAVDLDAELPATAVTALDATQLVQRFAALRDLMGA